MFAKGSNKDSTSEIQALYADGSFVNFDAMARVKHYLPYFFLLAFRKTALGYATDFRYKYGPEVHAEISKELVYVLQTRIYVAKPTA